MQHSIMSQFTNEQDKLLIRLVKGHRCLYDTSDINYKSTLYKNKVWDSIGELVKVPVLDCRKRWKHLRDHYLKRKKLEEHGGQVHRKWKYINQLSFLYSHYRRETVRDVYEEDSHIKSEEDTEDSTEEDQSEGSVEVLEDPLDKNVVSTSAQGQRSRKRKRNDSSSPTLDEDSEMRRDWNVQTEKKRNAIMKFFESMGDIVSSFPPQIAAETRLKVCQIVTDMELKLHEHGDVSLLPY